MKSKIKYIILISLIALNVLTFNVLKGKTQESHLLMNQEKKSIEKLKVLKKEQEINKNTVETQVFENTASKLNEKVKEVKIYTNEYTLFETIGNRFFQDYFNWGNSEERTKRKEVMKSYVEESVLNDKSIFDDGLDDTGQDYVKALGLKSKFNQATVYIQTSDDKDIVRGIVKSEYESWYEGVGDKTKQSAYYLLEFNREKTKVSKCKLLTFG